MATLYKDSFTAYPCKSVIMWLYLLFWILQKNIGMISYHEVLAFAIL